MAAAEALFDGAQVAVGAERIGDPALLQPFADGAGRGERALRGRTLAAVAADVRRESLRVALAAMADADLRDVLPNIAVPTLLIWGDADTETPLWMGKEMEQKIPDAGLVILEGGSHFAYLEQIQRFNTICKHFLKEDA